MQKVLAELATVDDPLIEVIGGLGIRLSNYLPTRTFELAVHGLDIARAAGVDFTLPEGVLLESVELALTGREPLPAEFSVV